MATWRDIDVIRMAHPDWGCARIAREFTNDIASAAPPGLVAWVRSTFQRRGWANPRSNDPALRAAARAATTKRREEAHQQFRQRSEFKMQTAPVIADEPPPIGIPMSRHNEDDKRSRRAERYSNFQRGFD